MNHIQARLLSGLGCAGSRGEGGFADCVLHDAGHLVDVSYQVPRRRAGTRPARTQRAGSTQARHFHQA